MIISLSGAPGSGKSTIAQMLAAKLGWPRYYIGGLRREAARKRGLSLAEYNKLGESDISTDKEVDEYQHELGEKEDNFVIEGRTSWYFIPHSWKIYLDVSKEEGAKRILGSLQHKNDRNEDSNIKTLADVLASTSERIASDTRRYRQYYNIDVYDKNNYDFYLDTSNLTPDQAFAAVLKSVQERLDNKKN